ncbi:[FeFe] hydrogenase H-cluster radical SAM maturase HydE [Anaeromassilibacillus senegalensis]|uniref:[FeFe] hydrogenase H-cluster radical SAM maturase HydE n=1 Tax=Anaeromassilibacillus senegalensis TaxID=1673717 RepID=UPI0006803074|nr:[FeFe] hydrogenase H-cluster radical SAM maturase HydE [Anaeromassilibacillus senegalensis]
MKFTREELAAWLARDNFDEIYAQADAIRRESVGDVVHIRALLEFSNHCKRLCRYCGLNAANQSATRFRMDPRDMVETAREAWEAGYKTIVLQSGEDSWYTADLLGEVVKQIKRTGMKITLSCGELPESVYRYWKDCGADRYLLKHETSDPKLYAELHPDGTLEERVSCLRTLKRLDFETGGGFMIGLPGQTLDTIAGDLLLLQEIGCDMAGIGPFIPHPDTPLRDTPGGSTELTKRAVALARLLLPKANLPATTALGVLDSAQKQGVFSCGANVIMRKVTPNRLKKLYQIYPASFSEADIRAGRLETEAEIRALNRTPV